jgi:O-methyltransferase involved in polyketide biosynthesis
MMRAAHLLFDGEPKIFSDPLALSLSGLNGEAALEAALARFAATLATDGGEACAQATMKYLRAGITTRSRFAEDELDRALERGVAQYVILGAGLDSSPIGVKRCCLAFACSKSIFLPVNAGSANACAR